MSCRHSPSPNHALTDCGDVRLQETIEKTDANGKLLPEMVSTAAHLALWNACQLTAPADRLPYIPLQAS